MSLDDFRQPVPGEVVKALLPFVGLVALAFLFDRLRGEDTARGPADTIRSAVARVGDGIAEKAWTAGRGAREEARKQRAWNLVQGATGTAFAMLSRRAAAGVYDAVTRGR